MLAKKQTFSIKIIDKRHLFLTVFIKTTQPITTKKSKSQKILVRKLY